MNEGICENANDWDRKGIENTIKSLYSIINCIVITLQSNDVINPFTQEDYHEKEGVCFVCARFGHVPCWWRLAARHR